MDTHNIATTLNTPILLVLLATISFCTGAANIAAATYVSRRLAHHQKSTLSQVASDKGHGIILDRRRHVLCGA